MSTREPGQDAPRQGQRPCVKTEGAAMMSSWENFPAGLRVLVVDDDPLCLKVVEQMLRRCSYEVTTTPNATSALNLLREKTSSFDLVLSDVYMPDMDGFKLLEVIGLEMDLPVIMMSSNGETGNVLRGVTHGAVDFLIKPVRIEELRNLWQHVVRRRRDLLKEDEDSEDLSCGKEEGGEGCTRKRKELSMALGDMERTTSNDDNNSSKKARVVWSVEMHQQFVNAVNQLGIDKAVPKKILEIMNVDGLTRENVASHLQKYRLYLRRVAGVDSSTPRNKSASSSQPQVSTPFQPSASSSDNAAGAAAAAAAAAASFHNTALPPNHLALMNNPAAGMNPLLGMAGVGSLNPLAQAMNMPMGLGVGLPPLGGLNPASLGLPRMGMPMQTHMNLMQGMNMNMAQQMSQMNQLQGLNMAGMTMNGGLVPGLQGVMNPASALGNSLVQPSSTVTGAVNLASHGRLASGQPASSHSVPLPGRPTGLARELATLNDSNFGGGPTNSTPGGYQGLLGMDNQELAAAFNDLYPSYHGFMHSSVSMQGGPLPAAGAAHAVDPSLQVGDVGKQDPVGGGMDDLVNFLLKS